MYSDLIGKPFKDFGRGPDAYDCWGLAREVFHRYGVDLPDFAISCKDSPKVSRTMYQQERKWRRLQSPVVPCLCVFRCSEIDRKLVSHLGVYVGNGRFLHASDKTGVAIERLDHPWWKRVFFGYYVPEEV